MANRPALGQRQQVQLWEGKPGLPGKMAAEEEEHVAEPSRYAMGVVDRLWGCKWVSQCHVVLDRGPTVLDCPFATMEEEVAGPGRETIGAVGRGVEEGYSSGIWGGAHRSGHLRCKVFRVHKICLASGAGNPHYITACPETWYRLEIFIATSPLSV